MVYFIEALGLNHVKIGSTEKGVENRLRYLQTGNSCRLRVLGTLQGGIGVEERIRQDFRHIKVRGEWFQKTDDLLAFIRHVTIQFQCIEILDDACEGTFARRHLLRLPKCMETEIFQIHNNNDETGYLEHQINNGCRFFGWTICRIPSHKYKPVSLIASKYGILYRASLYGMTKKWRENCDYLDEQYRLYL